MSERVWVSGERNNADWITRGLAPCEIDSKSEWWNGPKFLSTAVDKWETKAYQEITQKPEVLPGEKVIKSCTTVAQTSLINYNRFSSAEKLTWTVARIKAIAQMKSFRGGSTCHVNVSDLTTGKIFLIKEIQKSMETELQNQASGKYKSLMPVQDDQGIWVIGSRFSSHNPMTTYSDQPQILLPSYHPYTRILMRQAHSQSGHRGHDSTLARFRLNYWVPQGAKITRGVCSTCQKCKVRDLKLSPQFMGKLPKERLTPDFAFTHTM